MAKTNGSDPFDYDIAILRQQIGVGIDQGRLVAPSHKVPVRPWV